MPIKFFDMFAGIGGFRSGLEAVGGFECVGYCEIDKYAKQAYEAMYNTKGELYFDDARKINPELLQDIDLICGGFPCQSFSIAGERRGFEDVRGTLFFEIARIASVKRPKYLFLENVPGLLNHNQGRTFKTILKGDPEKLEAFWGEEGQHSERVFDHKWSKGASTACTDEGYDVVWQVCNSKDFGVPQSRKRVYIIGYNREKCRGKILSFTQANPKAPVQRLSGKEGERIYSTNGVSVTLTSSGGGFAGKTGMYCLENGFDDEFRNSCGIRIISKTKSGYQIAYPGDSIDTAFSGQNSRRGRVGNQIAHTLTTSSTQAYYFIDMNTEPIITDTARCITARYDSGISNRKAEHSGILVDGITEEEIAHIFDEDSPFVLIFKDKYGEIHFGRVRKFTPLECWSLQGFTDEQFYKAKATGLSDSRLYKMAGNAVTVPVISAIGKMLLDVESRNNKYEEWHIMIGFIIGLFVGCFIGVVVMALMNASSKADEQLENYKNNKTE